MKKIILKKKPKKVELKKKENNKDRQPSNDTYPSKKVEQFHNTLDRNIKLSEERNKTLGKPEIGKWYNYKERFPPNDFNQWIAVESEQENIEAHKSAVMLQHYISDVFCCDRKPRYPKWTLIPKQKEK